MTAVSPSGSLTSTPTSFISTDHANTAINLMKQWFPEHTDTINNSNTTIVNHLNSLGAPPLAKNHQKYLTFIANKAAATTVTATSTTTSTTTAAPSISDSNQPKTATQQTACLESWLDVFIDYGLFLVSLAGLDISKSSVSGEEFTAGNSGEWITGFEKILNKLDKAYEAFDNESSFSTIWGLAKAYSDLASGIWTFILKPMIESYFNGQNVMDWILEGVSVIATLLTWFASGSLAIIGQLVLAIESAVTFIVQLGKTTAKYPVAMFINALENTNGVFPALNPTIMQNDNPSSALLNGQLYLFFVQQDRSIGSLATTEEIMEELIEDEQQLKTQLSTALATKSGTGQTTVQSICTANKQYYQQAKTVVTNNASSPVAITFFDTIYLFYIQNSGPGTKSEGLYYITSTDGNTWSTTPFSVGGAGDITTPPSAIVCDNNLMLFWRGGKTNMQIHTNEWGIGEYDNLSWDGAQQLESKMTTNTSPAAWSYGNSYYLFFQSSNGDNTIWYGMKEWGTNGFSPLNQLVKTQTGLTPAVYMGDDGILTLYYASTDNSPVIHRYQVAISPPFTQDLYTINLQASQQGISQPQPQKTTIHTGTSPQVVYGTNNNYLMVCMVPGYPRLIPISTVNNAIVPTKSSSSTNG